MAAQDFASVLFGRWQKKLITI